MKLSGTIPKDHIVKLSRLKFLHLSNNDLSGSIPNNFGIKENNISKLQYLEELSLDNNNLNGSIPTNFANLENLRSLDLSNNSLSGTIPSDLGNLALLERLRLNNNNLDGSIPSNLNNLRSLFHLRVNNNRLDENIPSLSQLTNLRWADLSNNGLTGSITSQFNSLGKLRHLRLNDNNLFGSIPASLCSLGANLKTAGNNSSFSCPTTTIKKTSTTPTTAAPTTTPTTAAPTTTTTTAAPAQPRRQVLYGRGGSSVTFTTTSRPRGDLTISVSNIQIVNTCISNIDSFTISSATSRRTSQTSAYIDYSYVTNFSHRCSPGWLTMATADFTLKWRNSANVEQSSQPKTVTILRRIW